VAWDFEDIQRMLDEYIGNVDPGDPKGRKRGRILKSATDLFIEQGYRKTSVDEIAERAGVAKGTVYLYFSNKLDILIAATALEKKEYIRHFKALFDESIPPRQRLVSWGRNLLLVSREMPLISKLFLSGEREGWSLIPEMPPKLLEQQEMGLEFLGDLIAKASPRKLTPEQIRERVAVLRMMPMLAEPISTDQAREGLSLQRAADLLANTFVSGLFTPSDSAPPGQSTGAPGGERK
jgi:AcrR family transcriptional regulator